MRGRIAIAVVVGALGCGVPASSGAQARHEPVVYGYPYAGRCPGAGIADVVDRWGMYACNCTSYVAWALTANEQRTDWFVPGAMNAWNCPHVARLAGLRVDGTPAVGAVAVWPRVARPFGHVAYVIAVPVEGTISVAEYNYPSPSGHATYAFDTRQAVSTSGALFIHVPSRSRLHESAVARG